MTKNKEMPYLGFGIVQAKREGDTIRFDVLSKREIKPDESTWMEVNIPKNLSRREIHKLVDEWIKENYK